MSIRCVIIDDEPLALKVIEGYIRETSIFELAGAFTHPVRAVEFLNENEVDLMFVDIQMPDLTGLEVVAQLANKPVIIFTTAYSEYAIDGFKVDAIDYLLKPIDYPDFLKAAHKAKDYIEAKRAAKTKVKTNNDFLFIKSEYKLIRINFKEIRYIQGMSEYVKIHLLNAKPIMSLLSLKSLETQLPESMFMRVHKSFIVNLAQISMIERNEIIYDDGMVIPVSQQYKAKFQEFVDHNFML